MLFAVIADAVVFVNEASPVIIAALPVLDINVRLECFDIIYILIFEK
jgi:hypothetical protein